jgi:hypothetical protein
MKMVISKRCSYCQYKVELASFENAQRISVKMDVEMFHCGHCLASYEYIFIESEIVESDATIVDSGVTDNG